MEIPCYRHSNNQYNSWRIADRHVASVVQEWVEQGIEQGIEIGVVKGKTEGKAELLIELLHERFGSLSKDVKKRISSADADTLKVWSKNLFKASNLGDIFKDTK